VVYKEGGQEMENEDGEGYFAMRDALTSTAHNLSVLSVCIYAGMY